MWKAYNKEQMESILRIYFSEQREELLTRKSLNMVKEFLEFCKVKDIIDNSDTVALIERIYGNSGNNDENGDDEGKDDTRVFMSAATRFRFKKNVFELFKKYLSNRHVS